MGEEDQQYKKATQAVDDAMRTDTLGPNVCKVIREHLPTNDLLAERTARSIKNNPEVKEALENFIKDNQTMKRGKLIDRAITFAVGVVATGIVSYLINIMS